MFKASFKRSAGIGACTPLSRIRHYQSHFFLHPGMQITRMLYEGQKILQNAGFSETNNCLKVHKANVEVRIANFRSRLDSASFLLLTRTNVIVLHVVYSHCEFDVGSQ